MTSRIAAFGYHEIADDGRRTGFQRPGARPYRVVPARFDDHLSAIAAVGHTATLIDGIDPAGPGRHALITFDDGGASAMLAADLLEQRGWPGHFFIVTSLIGTVGFLDASQIRDLHARGHWIGSHSHTHPDIFRALSPEAMQAEWRKSLALLSDLLGEPVVGASVPGGDASREVFRVAVNAGIRYLFTSEPWTTPRRQGDGWILGRAILRGRTSARTVNQLADFRGWRKAMAVRRIKDVSRRLAPGLYRYYVKSRTRVDPARGLSDETKTPEPT